MRKREVEEFKQEISDMKEWIRTLERENKSLIEKIRLRENTGRSRFGVWG